jgi:tRNA (guanosine-2'-O-)-methyltransferase
MTPERFAKLRAVLDRRQPDLTVLAEDVHKAHNISAVLRTCDAVGISELHAVSPGGAFPRHRMISGGSRKWIRTHAHRGVESAIAHLHATGFRIVAAHLSPQSMDFRAVDFTQPTALLLGSELLGVSARAAALADTHIRIPMRGLVESLNVSVAAAVILYEAERQREAAGLYERCRLDPVTYRELLFEWCYPAAAQRLRAAGKPYPELDADGFIARPALAAAIRSQRRAAGTARHT